MCKYSLEGYAFRDAREGETLVVGSHYSGHGGVITPRGDKTMLVCVKHETKLTIEKLSIKSQARGIKALRGKFPHDRSLMSVRCDDVSLRSKDGKRHVVTLLDGNVTEQGYDVIEFEDGVVMYLSHITNGTEVYVGMKPTLEDKLHLDEKSLRVVRIDMGDPNPKPEDEDDKEKEEEEKKPDEQVAATSKPRTRVRRRARVVDDSIRF